MTERITNERLKTIRDWKYPQYTTGVKAGRAEVAEMARQLLAYRESGALEALHGLKARHNDGSDEKWWGEWDDADEAIAKLESALKLIAPKDEKSNG